MSCHIHTASSAILGPTRPKKAGKFDIRNDNRGEILTTFDRDLTISWSEGGMTGAVLMSKIRFQMQDVPI